MATQTTESTICIFVVTLISVVHSFMDIEELQSINYGISILKEPMVIPERHPESAILVTSRHGQQYQCNYPTHQEQKQQKEEQEKIALETGVVELLKPLSKQPCLLKTKDWWTYEICYGKYVRQYHLEDGQIKGNIMYLGHFQSDFDWNNETLRESRVRSKIASSRYHSQYYTNGSKCDLTGQGRQSEVRYLCEEGEDDYIVRVDEPETCVYVMTVHSHRICSHPHLKSPTPSKPIPIVCVPLLTDQQFVQYQAYTLAMKQKEEEAIARAKAEQEKLEKEAALALEKEEDDYIEDGLKDSVNYILKKTLGKELKTTDSAPDQATFDGDSKVPLGWKVVKELDDLEKLLDPQGILSNMDMSHKNDKTKTSKPTHTEKTKEDIDESIEEIMKDLKKKDDQMLEDTEEEEIEEEEDATVESELNEFEEEVQSLRERQAMTHKRLQQIRERVSKAVTSQFKDIIEEAEAEIGGEVNEAVAFKQLAGSLQMLMEKLEHTEKEMKTMDHEIAKLEDKDKDGEEKGGKEKEEKKKKVKEEEKEEEEESSEKEKDSKPSGVQAPPTTRQVHQKADEGRRTLKVTHIREEAFDKSDGTKPASSKHQKQLETSLKHSLEKAGVDPNSMKVHVKIIGSMNNKDDDDDDTTLHVLSEEESASFQNMIVAILGGGNEAVKEQKRHELLEDSYNFVFDQAAAQGGEADAKSSTASSHDSSFSIDDDKDEKTSSDSVPALPEQGL